MMGQRQIVSKCADHFETFVSERDNSTDCQQFELATWLAMFIIPSGGFCHAFDAIATKVSGFIQVSCNRRGGCYIEAAIRETANL